jgi:hypothetical protein
LTTAWLHSAVAASLTAQADRHTPNETGGILLGYRHDTDTVVINDTIGPGPNAEHRPDSSPIPNTKPRSSPPATKRPAAGSTTSATGTPTPAEPPA